MILNKVKKIIFVTSTRADFGKLKSLIKILKTRKEYKVYIIITGMHVMPKFGNTHTEVTKSFRSKIIKFNATIQKKEIIKNNKNFILDPTLPVLTNIKCTNTECKSNTNKNMEKERICHI